MTNSQVLEYIAVNSALGDKAKAEIEAFRAKEAAAQQRIPAVVDALIAHKRIDPSVRDKCAEALRDPVQALGMLLKAADPGNNTVPTPLGQPAGQPQAEKRADANLARSDQIFDEILFSQR
jgi:hypothetical protein